MKLSLTVHARSALVALYSKDAVFHVAMFDALQNQPGRIVEVDVLLPQVIAEGARAELLLYKAETRRVLVRLFKSLQRLDLGRYLVGRHGRRSRFVARRDLRELGLAAAGGTPVGVPAGPQTSYDLPVRPGYSVRLTLPSDLTSAEATRLARIVEALPFAPRS